MIQNQVAFSVECNTGINSLHKINFNLFSFKGAIPSIRHRFAGKCDPQSRDLTQNPSGYNFAFKPAIYHPSSASRAIALPTRPHHPSRIIWWKRSIPWDIGRGFTVILNKFINFIFVLKKILRFQNVKIIHNNLKYLRL